jgi:hypothetical protein
VPPTVERVRVEEFIFLPKNARNVLLELVQRAIMQSVRLRPVVVEITVALLLINPKRVPKYVLHGLMFKSFQMVDCRPIRNKVIVRCFGFPNVSVANRNLVQVAANVVSDLDRCI